MNKQKKFEGVRNENGSEVLQSTDFEVSEHQMLPQFSSFVPFSLSSSNTPPHPHPCLTIQQWNFLLEWGNDTAKRKIIKMGVTPLL